MKSAFWLVKFLEDVGYAGPRHFDAHAYRTEDYDGVRDFARGCMRTYLILKERAAQWNADAEIQALVAELGTREPQRGLGYERLDQLTMELLLGVRRETSHEMRSSSPVWRSPSGLRSSCRAPHRVAFASRRGADPRDAARRRERRTVSPVAADDARAEEAAGRDRPVRGRRGDGAAGRRQTSRAFKPDFAKYQAVVLNYDAPDDRWPAELKAAFERYVSDGGGLVDRPRVRQRLPRLEGVQRDDRRRRLARPHRAGRAVLVLQGRQAHVRHRARQGRQPRTAAAVQGHRPRRESSDHQGAARRVDAPGRRAVRGACAGRAGT